MIFSSETSVLQTAWPCPGSPWRR